MLLSAVSSLCCLVVSNQTDVEYDPVEDSLRDQLRSSGGVDRPTCKLRPIPV